MPNYLLDTNHASALLNGDAALTARLALVGPVDDVALSQPTVAELWFMVFNSARVDQNRDRLDRFLLDFTIWEFDSLASMEYGKIRAELRRTGSPIPAMDILIAAIARLNGLVLLTADAHFAKVSRVQTQNWLTIVP
jgi:tRNA(fMet)-specific endonuclease VapC